jgi:hypothetical protein
MTMVVEKHIEIPRIYDLDRMLNEYQTPQRHFIDRSCIAMCKVVVVVVMVTCRLWVVHCSGFQASPRDGDLACSWQLAAL